MRSILLFSIAALGLGGLYWGTVFFFNLAMCAALFMGACLGLRVMAALFSKPSAPPKPEISQWPRYTVLVPLFKEAAVVNSLMEHLARIDYPRDRLQIFMICEEDDHETLDAMTLPIAAPFELILVPKSLPRTKPKALNYAMTFATGDIITIYDAEDRPHPGQLKAAATALNAHPEWAAVQAPLDYYNSHDNWLTRQFTIEYAALFHVWVPFLSRCGLPFPLGGTSNHIRTTDLHLCGGWDAYNVTEDADMSFRLAANGRAIGYTLPPTEEEAVGTLGQWMMQRSRWMKGFIQTYIIHMSKPFTPGGWKGLKRQFTLQVTIGVTLLAGLFHVPSLIGLGLTMWIAPTSTAISIFLTSLGLSYACGMVIGAAGLLRAGKPGLMWHVFLMPIYWLLLFVPTLIAVYELFAKPFYWNKTSHGVTDAALKN